MRNSTSVLGFNRTLTRGCSPTPSFIFHTGSKSVTHKTVSWFTKVLYLAFIEVRLAYYPTSREEPWKTTAFL